MLALVAAAASACATGGASRSQASRHGAVRVERETPCAVRGNVVRWYDGVGMDACGVVRRSGPHAPGGDRGADERIEEMNAAMGR
jgi:hypothetical protein